MWLEATKMADKDPDKSEKCPNQQNQNHLDLMITGWKHHLNSVPWSFYHQQSLSADVRAHPIPNDTNPPMEIILQIGAKPHVSRTQKCWLENKFPGVPRK